MTIYTKASIHGARGHGERPTVLVTKGARIVQVGGQAEQAVASWPGHELVDCGGRVLAPLFVDSHVHFASYALFSAGLFVYEASTLDELFDLIRGYAARSAGQILGFGVSEHALIEARLPSIDEVNRVCEGRPLFLVKYDGHSAVVNTAMLESLPATVAKARGYDPARGILDAEAFYAAVMAISESVSIPKVARNMAVSAHDLLRHGIGMVHAVEGVGFKKDLDVTGVATMARGLDIDLRLFQQTLEIEKVQRRGLPRIGGCFACALDGCFGTHDAALHEPYADDPTGQDRGLLYYEDAQVKDFVARAHAADLQIELHAIGDRAVTQALDAFEAALTVFPRDNHRDDHRHTIIHASLVRELDKDRMARLGVGVAAQPGMVSLRQEPLSYLEGILGAARTEALVPIRSLDERGIRVSFGTDAPVIVPRTSTTLHAAMHHPNAGEAVCFADALRMHTRDGYDSSFDDDLGHISAGSAADFLILDCDEEGAPEAAPAALEPWRVVRRGRPVPKSPPSLAKLVGRVLGGLLTRRPI